MPYDTRCSAITQSGRRCRGKIRKGTDFCPFHDPALTKEQRRGIAAQGGRSRNRLRHLPDGYLRKLTNRTAVGHCMDRLYREVRLGIITPQMGAVLFNILCRLLDSGLVDCGTTKLRSTGRSKADRIRPKLRELLTPAERAEWKNAIADAPANLPGSQPQQQQAVHAEHPPASEADQTQQSDSPMPLAFSAAS
ncbi:MAG: hypothetical protein V3W34_02460 [Phycisphaerae bacterium]